MNALNNRGLWLECLVEVAALRTEGYAVAANSRRQRRQMAGGSAGTAKADARPENRGLRSAGKNSTPTVVPGAAPALAKAGVGGYQYKQHVGWS